MAKKTFVIKGNNAAEYFKITREEFLSDLKEIRAVLKEYGTRYGDPMDVISKITDIVQNRIGGL